MAGTVRHIWWTRKAVLLHSILAVCIPGFVALFWWQVQRVREGNGLSWAYVFEWPFFTGYAVYLWWKLIHDQDEVEGSAPSVDPGPAAGAHPDAGSGPQGAQGPYAAAGRCGPEREVGVGIGVEDRDEVPEEDEELAAYNRYLAALNASGRPKRW